MYVFGKNVARELLNENKKIKKIILSNNFKDEEITELVNLSNNFVIYEDKKKMDKLVDGVHQGIIIEIEDYKYYSEDKMLNELKPNCFIVILDHLEDPHNFGAIIRTCESAGVDYIIIPKDRSVQVNATVMKTSAGALNNVKIVKSTNLNNIIKKLKKKNVWIVGTDMENSCPYDKIDYTISTALVIGSEGFGMSELVKKNCDFIARIPMHGKINSLNASVAAGIMIYEVIRQRQ